MRGRVFCNENENENFFHVELESSEKESTSENFKSISRFENGNEGNQLYKGRYPFDDAQTHADQLTITARRISTQSEFPGCRDVCNSPLPAASYEIAGLFYRRRSTRLDDPISNARSCTRAGSLKVKTIMDRQVKKLDRSIKYATKSLHTSGNSDTRERGPSLPFESANKFFQEFNKKNLARD